jgi:predicted GIY-YIG superfamily endonuclease
MDKKTKQKNNSDNQIIIGKITKKQLNNTDKIISEPGSKSEPLIESKNQKICGEIISEIIDENVNQNVDETLNRSYYCYILRNSHEPDKNRTYNGYTVNPSKRIRQHNQEIKGGAIYTKSWGNKLWEIYVLITGFPDHHNALQCEWKIKHPAKVRTRPQKYNSPSGRIQGLNEILQHDKWTSKSEIKIKDLKLKIWIVNEYYHLLTNIPSNIEVISVPFIDLNNL